VPPKASEKKMNVSITDATADATSGARHQDWRRNRLKIATSSSWETRKAELDAKAMRGVARMDDKTAATPKPTQATRRACAGPAHRLVNSLIKYPTG
jgi:hypothetical protein